jgi:hypothetical protein
MENLKVLRRNVQQNQICLVFTLDIHLVVLCNHKAVINHLLVETCSRESSPIKHSKHF